jgi:ankyrin repeat protein
MGDEKLNVNAANKIGMTPLMYACAEDKVRL